MGGYPPIENHGLIGDLQTAALVSTDGTIDWMCLPRFDSPSIFASLLDKDHGGTFASALPAMAIVTRQMYLPGTAILITRYMSEAGVGEVIDFMPIAGDVATERHRLIRLVHVVSGEMTFEMECAPRFDYGREEPTIEVGGSWCPLPQQINDSVPYRPRYRPMGSGRQCGSAKTELSGPSAPSCPVRRGASSSSPIPKAPRDATRVEEVQALFEETRDFWRDWIGKVDLSGPLAGGSRALGDHPEAHDLRADRRSGRGADGRPT